MPRNARMIVLDEEQREELMAVIESEDTDLASRGKMILYCADNPSLKDMEIAKLLSTTDKSLRKWKSAYLAQGINGLLTSYDGRGRPSKSMGTIELRQAIEETMASQDKADWTVAELSAKFSVPEWSVYEALRQSDSGKQYKHLFTYQTRDVINTVPELPIGMYLSPEEQLIMMARITEDLEGCAVYGVFSTQNRDLSQELDNTPVPLGVLDTLVGARNHPERHQHGLMPSMNEVVRTVLASWTPDRTSMISIYYHSATTLAMPRLNGIRIHRSDSVNELAGSVLRDITSKSGLDAINPYQELLKHVLNFVEASNTDMVPFAWVLPYAEYHVEPVYNPESEIPVITNVQSLHNLHALLEETVQSAPPDSTTALLIKKATDGETYCIPTVIRQNQVLDPNLNPDTLDGFLQAANAFGKDAFILATDVHAADCKFSYEILKKKHNLIGPLKKVYVEYIPARVAYYVTANVAKDLRYGARILDATYRHMVCKRIISDSYRDVADQINDLTTRRQSGTELNSTIIENDVNREGFALIQAKEEETKRVLEAYGFDYDTLQHKDGTLPDNLQNHLPEFCVFNPGIEPVMVPNAPELHERAEERVLEELKKTPLDTNGDKVTDSNQVVNAYSVPDEEELKIGNRRRGGRNEVAPDNRQKQGDKYTTWRMNNTVSSLHILHRWEMEADESEVVYLSIDAVVVPKQDTNHIKGGKEFKKEQKQTIAHWNARIEWKDSEGFKSYHITSLDRKETFRQILAFLLVNNLYVRFFVFLTDGETKITTDIETYFKGWYYRIYLDFFHLSKVMYELLSMTIKSNRVYDPRRIEYDKKNNIKKNSPKTSLSILYARMLVRILWVGNVDEAIAYVKNINPDDIKSTYYHEKVIQKLNDRRKMITCYALRKKLGLKNSSNGVENTNQILVSDRQKDSQSSWIDYGSSAIANLSCLFANGEDERWFYQGTFDFKQ